MSKIAGVMIKIRLLMSKRHLLMITAASRGGQGRGSDFPDDAAKEHGFDHSNVMAIGYSNGANIAGSLLFHYEDALKGALLHHPMVPRRGIDLPDLTGTPVFIAAGENDPICPAKESEDLHELLQGAEADVLSTGRITAIN